MPDPLSIFTDPEPVPNYLLALELSNQAEALSISAKDAARAYEASRATGLSTSAFYDEEEPFDLDAFSRSGQRMQLLKGNDRVAEWLSRSMERSVATRNKTRELVDADWLMQRLEEKRATAPTFAEQFRFGATSFATMPGRFLIGLGAFAAELHAKTYGKAYSAIGIPFVEDAAQATSDTLREIGKISSELSFRALDGTYVEARERGRRIQEEGFKLWGNIGAGEIGSALGSLIPVMATGGLAGLASGGLTAAQAAGLSLAAGAGTAGAQSFGEQFLQSRGEGDEFWKASGKASAAGAITFAVTALSMKLFGAKGIERLAGVIGKSDTPKALTRGYIAMAIGSNAAEELGEEGIDQLLQSWLIEGKSFEDAFSDAVDAGILGGILGGAVGGGMDIYSHRRGKAQQGIDNFNDVSEVLESVSNAFADVGSPEMAAEFAQAGLLSSPTSFVDAEAIVDIVAENPEFAEELKSVGLDAEVAKDMAGGSLVQINTASLVKLTPEARARVMENWHANESDLSKVQAEAILGEKEVEAKVAANDNSELTAGQREFHRETARIFDSIVAASDQVTPEQVAVMMALPVQHANVVARRWGKPEKAVEFLKRVMFQSAEGPVVELASAVKAIRAAIALRNKPTNEAEADIVQGEIDYMEANGAEDAEIQVLRERLEAAIAAVAEVEATAGEPVVETDTQEELLSPEDRRSLENQAIERAEGLEPQMRKILLERIDRIKKTMQDVRADLDAAETLGDKLRAESELLDLQRQLIRVASEPGGSLDLVDGKLTLVEEPAAEPATEAPDGVQEARAEAEAEQLPEADIVAADAAQDVEDGVVAGELPYVQAQMTPDQLTGAKRAWATIERMVAAGSLLGAENVRDNEAKAILVTEGKAAADAYVEAFNRAMNGEVLFQSKKRRSSDIGHKRESGGRYVGAPDWVDSPNKLPKLRSNLRQLALEGAVGRFWYEQSSDAILEMADGDIVEAEIIVALIAIYSANATVVSNTAMALRAYYQWKNGEPIQAGTSDNNKKAESLLRDGIRWEGIKTNSFYQNLMVKIDPSQLDPGVATMDMWMALAFDYGMKSLDQGPKYRFAERETQRLGEILGWPAHQVQAAIWVGMRSRIEPIRAELRDREIKLGIGKMVTKIDPETGKPSQVYEINKGRDRDHYHLAFKMGMATEPAAPGDLVAANFDYSNALNKHLTQISWEATPGESTGVLPGIHNASTAQKSEYLKAILEVLTEDGANVIAKKLGLPVTMLLVGLSAWHGDIGAGAQTFAIAPAVGSKGKRAVIGPARRLLNLYSAIKGYVLSQEAVVWHQPVRDDADIRYNGFEIESATALSENEMRLLYTAVNDIFGTWDIAPGYMPNGARLLNFIASESKADGEQTEFEYRGFRTKKGKAGITVSLVDADWNETRLTTGKYEVKDVDGDPDEVSGGTVVLKEAPPKGMTVKIALNNNVYQDWMENRVMPLVPDEWGGGKPRYHSYRSDGEYISNNWEKSPNGEGYQSTIRSESPALLEFADDLRARVAAVNETFIEKYGWDRAGEPATEPAPSPGRGQRADQLVEDSPEQGRAPPFKAGLNHLGESTDNIKENFDNKEKFYEGDPDGTTIDDEDLLLNQIVAFHGTFVNILGALKPEERRFLLKFIGNGEGQQAFSWGLYFTNVESIGRWYANNLAMLNGKVFLGEVEMREITEIEGEPVDQTIREIARAGILTYEGNIDEAIEKATELVERARQQPWAFDEDTRDRDEAVLRALEGLRRQYGNDIIIEPTTRYLLKVNLWMNNQQVLIDWDNEIGDRPAIVDAVRKAIPEGEIAFLESKYRLPLERWTGELAYNNMVRQAAIEKMPGERGGRTGPPKSQAPRAVSMYLLSQGIDGVEFTPGRNFDYYIPPPNSKNYVVFDENAIDIVNNELFQSRANSQSPINNQPLKRGSTLIHDNNYLVTLFTGQHDLTTVLHEFWHIFLHELAANVEAGVLDADAIAGMKALNEWFNANGLPDWDQMTKDQREEAHEMVAESGEFYLATAEAPSVELEAPFARFRKWVTDIYENIDDLQARGEMTEEVKGTFDRLLATKKDVEELMLLNELMGRGTNELDDKLKGVGEKTRSKYNRLWNDIRNRVRDAAWKKRIRETAKDDTAQRKVFRAQVETEPVYMAWQAVLANGGLNWKVLNGIGGAELIKALRDINPKLVAKKADKGIRPEAAALDSGFETEGEMLSALRNTNSPTNEIEKRMAKWRIETDREIDPMEAVLNDPNFQEAIELMGRMLNSMLKTGTPRLKRKAIQKIAQGKIKSMPGGLGAAIRVDLMLAEMDKSRKLERRAIMRDEFNEALKHNHDTQVKLEMVKLSIKLRDARKKFIRKTQKMVKAKKGTIEWAHHYFAAGLAQVHGVVAKRKTAWPPPTHTDAERKGQPVTLEDVLTGRLGEQSLMDQLPDTPSWLQDTSDTTHLRDMSVDQFLELQRLLDMLETRGKFIVKEREDVEALAGELIEDMVPLKKQFRVPFGGPDAFFGKWVDKIANGYKGGISQMSFLHRAMAGFFGVRVKDLDTTKAAIRELELPALRAEQVSLRLKGEMAVKLEGPLAQLRRLARRLGHWPDVRDIEGNSITNPEERADGLGRDRFNNMDIIGLALYSGTEYSRAAVAEGMGWLDADGNPDYTIYNRLISVLEDPDWDAVVAIRDALDSIWDEQVRVYTIVYGFPPTKVDGADIEIVMADGRTRVIRGGYFPLRFDARIDLTQARQDEVLNMKDHFNATFVPAVTPSGHLKERVGTGGKPVLLNAAKILGEHIEFSTRFISHAELVHKLSALFRHDGYQAMLRSKFGRRLANEQLRWLRALVLREYENLSSIDDLIEAWRPLASLYVLGFKASAAITQTEAIMSLSADIGWGNYMGSVRKLTTDLSLMHERWQLMMDDPVMKDRWLGAGDRDLRDLLQGFDFSPIVDRLQSLVPNESFREIDINKGLSKIQKLSLLPVLAPSIAFEFFAWSAMYDQEIEKHGDPDEAGLFATNAILSTGPSSLVKDLGSIQRSKKGAFRIISMLMTATIRRMNSNMFIMRAMREGKVGLGQGMAFIGMSWFGAAILPSLIMFGLHELGDDDEGEDWGDKAKRFLGIAAEDVLLYQIQGIPLSFEIVRWAEDLAENGDVTNFNIGRALGRQPIGKGAAITARMLSAIFSLPFNLGSEDEEEREAAYWALADAAAFYMGVPVTRIWEDIQKGRAQMEKGAGPAAIIRREPPGTRE